jgi:hypothetical protein
MMRGERTKGRVQGLPLNTRVGPQLLLLLLPVVGMVDSQSFLCLRITETSWIVFKRPSVAIAAGVTGLVTLAEALEVLGMGVTRVTKGDGVCPGGQVAGGEWVLYVLMGVTTVRSA